MATDAIVWLHEQAMLPLQAKSLEADAGARIARIQPFWKTLSAQSRMDLLSIPIAAFRQHIAAAKAEHWAAEQKAKGTKRSSALQQGSPAMLQLQRTCRRFSSSAGRPPVC